MTDSIKESRMPAKSSTEVRIELGLTIGRFQYLLLSKPELSPPMVAGRRVWSEAAIRALKRAHAEAPRRGSAKADK
jgi:hypothetical protein